MDKRKIFITGVGRSGTTLLQAMLNEHSNIHIPPETHFFKRYILPFLISGKRTVIKDDVYLNRLPDNKRRSLETSTLKSIDDYKSAMMDIMSSNGQEDVIGDKDTEYVRYLPHLKYLFPDAYFIHIKRDPRDVIASRLKTNWGKKRPLHFHVAEYHYYIKKLNSLGPKLFGQRFMELKYEELIKNPEKELNAILSKLNLNFESEMLHFYKNNNNLVAEDEKAWKENISNPLDSDNTGKWRSSLTTASALLIQDGIEDFFHYNNYELLNGKAKKRDIIKVRFLKNLFKLKSFKEKLPNA